MGRMLNEIKAFYQRFDSIFKQMVPDDVNLACLRLFGSVLPLNEPSVEYGMVDFHELLTKSDMVAFYELLTKYYVLVLPDAWYSLMPIKKHVEKTRQVVQHFDAAFYERWAEVVDKAWVSHIVKWFSFSRCLRDYKLDVTKESVDQLPDGKDYLSTKSSRITHIGAIESAVATKKCEEIIYEEDTPCTDKFRDCISILAFNEVKVSLSRARSSEARNMLQDLMKAE